MKYFVTAIGTDSGKTLASAILTRALDADYWKPVQSGLPGDSEEIQRLTASNVTIHPEQYRLSYPASPHLSAARENVRIAIRDFSLPDTEHLIIEGAGGIMVPLNDNELIIDLAAHWKVPVILVSNIYLGSINHTLLSISYLIREDIPVAGIIFNGPETISTESIIEKYCPWPVLLRIRPTRNLTPGWVDAMASELRKALL